MKHLSKQKKKEYANNPRYNEVAYIEFPLNSNYFMVHTAAHLGQIICFYEVSQATKPDYSPKYFVRTSVRGIRYRPFYKYYG